LLDERTGFLFFLGCVNRSKLADMPDLPASQRVAAWKNAWESRDPARVVSLYAKDATHASAKVAALRPELGRSCLRGHAEIEQYAATAFRRFTWLRFELLTVTESGDRAAVEYLRHSNLDADNPSHVLELLEWREGLLSGVRVFHF
jgi:ketosteroid isomerase-like protein